MEEPNAPEAPSAGDNGTWNTEPVTIAAAINLVADALPDRVDGAPLRITDHPDGSTSVEAVQPTIPGIHPPFDKGAALDMIAEHERAARAAEKAHAEAVAVAKELRKEADEANAALRKVIRELDERRHDARYDPHEQAATVEGEVAASDEVASNSVAPSFSREAGRTADDEMPPATLKELLSKAGADITVEQIAAWNPDEQTSARVWAEAQRDANAGLNGESVSVAWPAHVSAAHSGDSANRYPKKGKRKKAR